MKRALILILLFFVPASASAQDLERAYQKEFVYLQAQKTALTERVAQLEREISQQTGAEEGAIVSLQNRLVSLQLQAETLEGELAEAERNATRTDEHSESLLAVFEQADASLDKYGVEVGEPGETVDAAELKSLFAAAGPVLDDASTVRRQPGSFFLPDGRQVDGELVHVGRIATYGVAEEAAGALAPAGDDHLKLWPADAAATARTFARGDSPDTLKIFLYESVEKAVEEQKEKTALETVEAGGVIAWVIVALGALAALLAMLRVLILALASTRKRVIDEVCELVAAGRLEAARTRVEKARGSTAKVVGRALQLLSADRETADDGIAQTIFAEAPRIERFGTAIMVFAAVSPLLGLLGTVTGMIATFDVITEYGTGDPKMLSGGISEALITTQLGLIVAIPALLVGNLLNSRAASLIEEMEHAALRVTNAARLGPQTPPDESDEELMVVNPNLTEALG